MLDFLAAVRWEQSGPEATWRENAKPRMHIAGLRDDDEAVEVGIAIIRDLVMRGAGPQSTDELAEPLTSAACSPAGRNSPSP